MCPLICFHEVLCEDNFCDFCNADPSVECECAGEYHGPLNRRCCAGPDDSEPDDASKRSEVDMTDEKESGGEQQVYQVRERSQTISVPRPSEPGREEGQPIYQVRERARTMNVQRHGEPGLTCVRPAPAQLGSWSTGEPMISKHRTLPCQCDKIVRSRSRQSAPYGGDRRMGRQLGTAGPL